MATGEQRHFRLPRPQREGHVQIMSARLLKRWGGALALLAYCFQLLISLGHVHADEVFGALGHAVELGNASTRVTAKAPDGPDGGDRSHQDDTSESCQICSAVHAAATGVQPPTVQLTLPMLSGLADRSPSEGLRLTRPQYLYSHTRAPPALSA
jgi:hypothetical protein